MRIAQSLAVMSLVAAPLVAAAPAMAQKANIVMEEFMVPAKDAGIEIYVRNKRPADMNQFRPDRTVLFVHGATYPAHTAFDLQLGGMSWMDYIAARGFDVYLLDLRGYGKSTRPPEMDQPAEANAPIVLFAPQWVRQSPSLVQGQGAYRVVKKDQALARWMTGVPEDKKAALIPPGWFDAWADATFASDPWGRTQNPPALRAPNGVIQDGAEFWSAGKSYYDPAKVTVPTLLVHGEWDRDTPPYMAQTLFPLLVNAPGKRYVALAEGTHTIIMERNRMALFEAVQAFLEEPPPRS
jgi:pimeloyl-ACP methyl ester carboxylesterase